MLTYSEFERADEARKIRRQDLFNSLQVGSLVRVSKSWLARASRLDPSINPSADVFRVERKVPGTVPRLGVSQRSVHGPSYGADAREPKWITAASVAAAYTKEWADVE